MLVTIHKEFFFCYWEIWLVVLNWLVPQHLRVETLIGWNVVFPAVFFFCQLIDDHRLLSFKAYTVGIVKAMICTAAEMRGAWLGGCHFNITRLFLVRQ
jgi:hypothetical protein